MSNTEHSSAGRNAWLRWLLLAVIIALAVGFYALGLQEYLDLEYVRSHLADFHAAVQQNYVAALIAFFLLYTLATALSLPAAWILSMLAGALFGRWLGTAMVLLAATIGATLAFLSSRFVFGQWVQHRLGARLDTFNRGVEKDGAYYLFTLRLVPLFPFFLINLGMGLTPMRTWPFFWVSLIGMLPGTFLYVNAGTELSTLQTPRDILSAPLIASFILLGLAPLAFRWSVAQLRRHNKHEES